MPTVSTMIAAALCVPLIGKEVLSIDTGSQNKVSCWITFWAHEHFFGACTA